MMKTSILLIMLGLAGMFPLFAQENRVTELSLRECVQAAVERNIHTQAARIEHEKSGHKVSETRAALLPKISASGSFQDYLKKPVTIFSGDMVGQPGNLVVEIGTQYTTGVSVGVNQALYNQTALTALRLSKTMESLSALGVEKASEELAVEVSKLYFLSLTTARQKTLEEENIARIRRLSDITQTLTDHGMAKQVDYERISVSLENLRTRLSNTEASLEQQLNMIKYMLEIPLDETIVLTDTVEMPLLAQLPAPASDFSGHIDIRILENQKEVSRLNQRAIAAAYLPSLSFTGQYAYQGFRQDFGNYFRSSSEDGWYGSSYIGLSLSIPIFDGMEKRSKSRQARLDYQKTAMMLDDTRERFGADYRNAMNNWQNHRNNVQRQKQNIALAENVYRETALKYREGLASMSDLLQDEMALSNAQSGYLNALYNFKDAELKIMSLNGEIRNLINK